MTVLQQSAVFGFADRVMFYLKGAIETSAARRRASAIVAKWLERPPTARRFDVGVTLLTAASVHIALRWWQGPDPGWLWLIFPLTTALIGALHIAASRVPESH